MQRPSLKIQLWYFVHQKMILYFIIQNQSSTKCDTCIWKDNTHVDMIIWQVVTDWGLCHHFIWRDGKRLKCTDNVAVQEPRQEKRHSVVKATAVEFHVENVEIPFYFIFLFTPKHVLESICVLAAWSIYNFYWIGATFKF